MFWYSLKGPCRAQSLASLTPLAFLIALALFALPCLSQDVRYLKVDVNAITNTTDPCDPRCAVKGVCVARLAANLTAASPCTIIVDGFIQFSSYTYVEIFSEFNISITMAFYASVELRITAPHVNITGPYSQLKATITAMSVNIQDFDAADQTLFDITTHELTVQRYWTIADLLYGNIFTVQPIPPSTSVLATISDSFFVIKSILVDSYHTPDADIRLNNVLLHSGRIALLHPYGSQVSIMSSEIHSGEILSVSQGAKSFTVESSRIAGLPGDRPRPFHACNVFIRNSTLLDLSFEPTSPSASNCTFVAQDSNFTAPSLDLDHVTVAWKNVDIDGLGYLRLRPHFYYPNNYTLDNVFFGHETYLDVGYDGLNQTEWVLDPIPDAYVHSPSSLSVYELRLWGGLTLIVDNIEIRGMLRASNNSLSSTLSSSPTSLDNTWNFWSIGIENVTLDIYNVKNFTYTASEPDIGIYNVLPESPISIVPSIPNITLIWPYDSIHDPEYGRPYAIFNSTVPGQQDKVYYVRPLGSPYEFEINASSTITTFRMLSKSLPTVPLDQCPVVPPGFLCSASGVFYPLSLHTTSITLPPKLNAVMIFGNLAISDSALFVGTETSLNVAGCAKVVTLKIELNASQPLPDGPVNYVTQSPECEALHSEISLTQAPLMKRKCEELKVERDTTAPKTHLSVLFRIDNSKCDKKKNLAWIAAPVVVVVAVLIIGTLIYFLMRRRLRRNLDNIEPKGRPKY